MAGEMNMSTIIDVCDEALMDSPAFRALDKRVHLERLDEQTLQVSIYTGLGRRVMVYQLRVTRQI